MLPFHRALRTTARTGWTIRHRGVRWNSTKIEKIILDNIKATGPISFASYMQFCLSHPTDGYYMNPAHKILGARGDFTTSPEISQVFGELIAIWLLTQWISAGRPPIIRLVELGPGRGTLMDDVLRVVSKFTPASVDTSVHLVETSLAMRALQKSKLEVHGVDLVWYDSINDIPSSAEAYTMLLAHEFFDALPFHVLQKTAQGFQEILVASGLPDSISLTPVHNPSKLPSFRQVLSPATPSATLLGLSSPRFSKLSDGARIEVSPIAWKIARTASQLVSAGAGGAGLIVDYGADHLFGDSFRAFKDHTLVDVFHRPGECDLTVNVDFAYLKEAMRDATTTLGPISQNDFLTRMGLHVRVERLVNSLDASNNGTQGLEDRQQAIENAAERLVSPTGMGGQYRVMGMVAKAAKTEDVWPFVNISEEK